MHIQDSENDKNTFIKAEHDAFHLDHVENLYFEKGGSMPGKVQTIISEHLQASGLTIKDLEAGAELTIEESLQLQSPLSDPRLSTIKKACSFLGVQPSALLDNNHNRSVVINVESIQVEGNYVSVHGDYIASAPSEKHQSKVQHE